MVINPGDEEALKRTINYPKRGIGDTTVQKIFDISGISGARTWDIILNIDDFQQQFNSGTRSRIAGYRDLISGFSVKTKDYNAYEAAREIASGSGIMRELREGKMPEEISRLENFEELLNAMKEFTEAADTNGEPSSLEAYLQNVALLTDQDNEKEDDRNKVTLMTMHSAKGLEFSHVYITGMEDTLFPSPMSAGNPRELEEERRLFYVALTRAEKQATLTYALNRYKWGNLEHSKPSRFIKELDQKLVDYPQTAVKSTQQGFRNRPEPHTFREEPKPYSSANLRPGLKRVAQSSRSSEYSSVNQTSTGDFTEGDTVIHERFGKGIIISIEGEQPNTTALVDFETDGKKKLLLRFAKLKRVP